MDTSAARQPIIVQFLSKHLSGEIGTFAVKAVIAAAVMLGAFAIGTNMLISSLERTIERSVQRTVESVRTQLSGRVGGRGFWVRVEDELDRLAKSDPPAQKKQQVLSNLRVISEKWRPFLLEAASSITGNEIVDQKNRATPANQ